MLILALPITPEKMKRLLLLSVCLAVVAASCSKNAAVIPKGGAIVTVKDTITATINGVNETFNSVDTVRSNGPSGMYISGTNAASSDKIILILGTLSQNGVGTYSSSGANMNNIQMLYGQGPGYTPANYFYTYHPTQGTAYDCTVTITEFTYTTVKGTFSGSLIQESALTGGGTQPPKTVTNGKFTLSLK
jgi:hypothetical protein